MTNKLIYIPNDDTQNYPFFRLQLVVETFEWTLWIYQSKFDEIPKIVKPKNKKTLS